MYIPLFVSSVLIAHLKMSNGSLKKRVNLCVQNKFGHIGTEIYRNLTQLDGEIFNSLLKIVETTSIFKTRKQSA